MASGKAAAAAATLIALMAVGAVTYTAARDEPEPLVTTTTTSLPTSDEIAVAIATSLSEGLEVPLDATEARCVADGLVALLGHERLEALTAQSGDPALTEAESEVVVRTIVQCVPADKAAALLSTTPSTTIVVDLPDEGVQEPSP